MENLSGVWSAINKEHKPRDLLFGLKISNSDPLTYKRDLKQMVNLVQEYPNNLQSDSLTTPTYSPEYAQKLKSALQEILASQKLHDMVPSWEISMLGGRWWSGNDPHTACLQLKKGAEC
jgi:hypothetical protein